MLDGAALSAVVIGGGSVAARRATALAASGARVHVVAPEITPDIESLARDNAAVRLTRERYSSSHIDDALLVVAATDDSATNSLVAADARARGRLVNVASAPGEGNCITPAIHRAGDVVVAVSAGGVPRASARIRDALGRTYDERYADAVRELASLRRTMLDSGKRDQWSTAAAALIGDDFCSAVESGRFMDKAAEWR
jgi:precorrin-2 dehydrogenase/sirohydrochlorin ferrochelatase